MSIILNRLPKADPNFDNVSLLMHMDGANGSNSFADSSKNNFSISNIGNVIQSNTTAKFGNTSAFFDGSSELQIPHNALFDFESQNFTIEAWVNASDSTQKVFVTKWLGTFPSQEALFIMFNFNLRVYWNQNIIITNGGNIPSNQWAHVAIVRNGTNIITFINGIQTATSNIGSTAMLPTPNAPLRIGGSSIAFSKFNGYMQELRVTKGVARYISNFTPPIEPFPNTNKTNTIRFLKGGNKKIKFLKPLVDKDPYFNNVSLLMHMDGPTEFIDSSSNNLLINNYNNTTISSDIKKFDNGGSAYFPGNSNYLKIDNNNLFGLGNNFTIEAWVYPTSTSNGSDLITIVDLRDTGTQQGTAMFLTTNTMKVFFYDGPANSVLLTNGTISINTWTHIAAVRNGTTWQVYIDGVLDTAAYTSSSNLSAGRSCFIGTAADSPGNTRNFIGYIDELRITKGVSRYTSNFQVPTAPFPNQ